MAPKDKSQSSSKGQKLKASYAKGDIKISAKSDTEARSSTSNFEIQKKWWTDLIDEQGKAKVIPHAKSAEETEWEGAMSWGQLDTADEKK